MRAITAYLVIAAHFAATGTIHAQTRGDVIEPRILNESRAGDIHPLVPNHRLDTITLGGFVRPTANRAIYIVSVKRTSIADGRATETNWPGTVMYAGETSSVEKLKRREFTVSPGSPTPKTKQDSSPTVVTLTEGSRVEIGLLESGDDLITVDVTYEELSIHEGESVDVRDKIVAAPQQTSRRIRTFRTAKLGSNIAIPLDAATIRDARQVLQLQVSRK